MNLVRRRDIGQQIEDAVGDKEAEDRQVDEKDQRR